MTYLNRCALILLGALTLSGVAVSAREITSMKHNLNLSPELLELLRAEMRELLKGAQSLPAGISAADWAGVAKTGAQIKVSYIFDRKLTAAQRRELETSLPEHFKRLDADFHLEAGKLEEAAKNHDAQLSAFHFYRLIETCATCHSLYATSKFPGFVPAASHGHGH